MGHSAVAFVIVIGVLVFVHELGHFLVARLCGVGVEVFLWGSVPKYSSLNGGGPCTVFPPSLWADMLK